MRRSGIRETPRLGAQYRLSDLPDEKPRITGITEKYQIGETLDTVSVEVGRELAAGEPWPVASSSLRGPVAPKVLLLLLPALAVAVCGAV